mgnify:CR=1 FL=1
MKKLEHNSEYNQFDINGDGIVTDEELNRSEKMLQIEMLQNKQEGLVIKDNIVFIYFLN